MRRPARAAEAFGGPDADADVTSGADADVTSGADADVTSGADATPADAAPRSPTPHDLAELGGTFAMTAGVLDPEEDPTPADASADDEPATGGPEWTGDEPAGHGRLADDPHAERGLRGLVGGGSSQVSGGAALRARDAARPSEADLAAAEAELVIVRRGWLPREDLPPRGPRR
jgi:hypothetical protein